MIKNKSNQLLVILGLMTFFASGDTYSAAPLLLEISKELDIKFSQSMLSVVAYMLAFGVFTIIFGPLSDRFGKTKVLKTAAIGTAIFSCLGALAFNLQSLVIFRGINGAFAAGIFPVAIALVGETYNQESRQKAIGKVMGMMFLGNASATAIGGIVSYFGSWRLVYLIYGGAEIILAIIMLKVIVSSKATIDSLNIFKVYKKALSNKDLRRTVGIIFLVGFSVMGSFMFTGELVQSKTEFNILVVGLILTLFGIGTLIGGRRSQKLRMMLKNKLLIFAGTVGCVSFIGLFLSSSPIIIGLCLFGFGLAFILFQSTLVHYAQECLPTMRGTVMSLASFHMVVGGSVGTMINQKVMDSFGINYIFLVVSIIIFIAGILATIKVFNKKNLVNA